MRTATGRFRVGALAVCGAVVVGAGAVAAAAALSGPSGARYEPVPAVVRAKLVSLNALPKGWSTVQAPVALDLSTLPRQEAFCYGPPIDLFGSHVTAQTLATAHATFWEVIGVTRVRSVQTERNDIRRAGFAHLPEGGACQGASNPAILAPFEQSGFLAYPKRSFGVLALDHGGFVMAMAEQNATGVFLAAQYLRGGVYAVIQVSGRITIDGADRLVDMAVSQLGTAHRPVPPAK
jgi:hypothetical protein